MIKLTPLELTADMLGGTEREAEDDTEARRLGLGAIRQSLLRLEAVRARSWLWAGGGAAVGANAAGEGTSGTKTL